MCVCVCARVCLRARACVRVCVQTEGERQHTWGNYDRVASWLPTRKDTNWVPPSHPEPATAAETDNRPAGSVGTSVVASRTVLSDELVR